MRIRARRGWSAGWDRLRDAVIIECDGDRIVDVVMDGAGSSAIDVDTECTVMPGLIDCHEHIGVDVGDEHAQAIEEAGTTLLRGADRLRTMVVSGVTSIRDCGERADIERFWIAALAKGEILGPHVVRSVTPICRTGGHVWYLSLQVDGPDNVRAAVRRNVRDGADFIKAMVTGGLSTLGSDVLTSEFTQAELQTLIQEAHHLGRKVAGHAYGGEGVDWALEAGIDSIEHGAFLTVAQLQTMAAKGTFLVLTTSAISDGAQDPRVPEPIRRKQAQTVDDYMKTIRNALSASVRIALGSDCIHGRLDREVLQLVECGASPELALRAATADGAELAGLPLAGHLKRGHSADLLFVAGNPLEDPSTLSNPIGVLSAGQWARPLPGVG
jgi:imidazolonepropionase-like amidohydrolase